KALEHERVPARARLARDLASDEVVELNPRETGSDFPPIPLVDLAASLRKIRQRLAHSVVQRSIEVLAQDLVPLDFELCDGPDVGIGFSPLRVQAGCGDNERKQEERTNDSHWGAASLGNARRTSILTQQGPSTE